MEPTQKIKLPNPYKQLQNKIKSLKKIDDKLKLLNKTGSEKIISFVGSNEVEAMFYLYLFKKYKSNCFLHDKNVKTRTMGLSFEIKDNYTPIEEQQIMTQLTNLSNLLINCITRVESNIIIIPVQLLLPQGDAHANVLIYRKNLRQIEHFEPHGSNFSRNKMNIYNQIIERWIKAFVVLLNTKLISIKQPDVKFIDSSEVCPRIDGLQNLEGWSSLTKIADLEPSGYCAAWSLFFTELCLKNPEIPSSELLNYIFNILERMDNAKKMNYLREIIRGYSVFINEKIGQYFSVFFKSGLTIEKLKNLSRIDLFNFRNIIKNVINLEIKLSTDPSHLKYGLIDIKDKLTHLNRHLNLNSSDANLKKQIEQLTNKKNIYELYNNFNVISKPSESLSSPKKSIQPKQVKKEPKLVTKTKTCPEGKELNENGRCVKIKTQKVKVKKEPKQAKICPEGKEINENGRCVKIKTQKVKVKKEPNKIKTPEPKVEVKAMEPMVEERPKIKTPEQKVVITKTKTCPEGKEFNQITGRCVKIKTQKVRVKKEPIIKEPLICPEGCVRIKTKKDKKDKKDKSK